MAVVRKRSWKVRNETKSAWVADYTDQEGKRRLKTFSTKKAADVWLPQTMVQVGAGTHTAESKSITITAAAALWIKRGELEGLERSTLSKYRNHVDLHILPLIGQVKLAKLSAPAVQAFRDDLVGRLSRALAKKVLGSLRAILTEAQRRGLVHQNVAQVVKIRMNKREETKLATGRDIPSKVEIRTLLATVTDRWRPFFVTAVFTGMRSSEMRGLRWEDVDFDKRLIHVRQRADQWGEIGSPKSENGHREIPISPLVWRALKDWRLICPQRFGKTGQAGELWLVFPNGRGKVESHSNIINRGIGPLLIKAGCSRPDPGMKDEKGAPMMRAKYGMHAFRHFFASWAIEQGFSAKKLQELMGHGSIQVTFDVYGHLFDSVEDDQTRFAAGELAVVND